MKLNFDKNPTNKKMIKKIEQQKHEDHSSVVRHADYLAFQEKEQSPFGKTFKTGAHIDKKKEIKKGKEKHKGKGWE
jgi:hypothetical protein